MQGDDAWPCCFKLLAPSVYALVVMGRNDSNIAPFMEHAKCRLSSTPKGETFPQTEDQVITVQAQTDDALASGVQMIVQTLCEAPPQGPNGEYRLRVIVPQKAVTLVVGKGGESLKRLQQKTGITVEVDEKTWCGTGPDADQLLTFAGRIDGMQAAVATTIEHMKQLKSCPWLPMWIARQNSDRVAEANMLMQQGCMGGMDGGMDGGMGMGMGNVQMSMMQNGTSSSIPQPNGTLGNNSFEILQSALRMIPDAVSQDQRGFSLRCAVPNRFVEGLLGKGGSVAQQVKDMTGARIDIQPNQNESESRSMSITGPLFSTVAAYIYMMKQYLEIEATVMQQEGGGQMGMGMSMGMGSAADMKPMCAQALQQMEQQLMMQLQQVKELKQQLASLDVGGGQQMAQAMGQQMGQHMGQQMGQPMQAM